MLAHHNTDPGRPPVTDPEASPADSTTDEEAEQSTEDTGSEDPGSEVDQPRDPASMPGRRPPSSH